MTKDPSSFFSFLLSHCLPVKLLYQSVGSSRSLFSLKNRVIFWILSPFENYSNPFETRMYEEANELISHRVNRSSSGNRSRWFFIEIIYKRINREKKKRNSIQEGLSSVLFFFSDSLVSDHLVKEWSTINKDNINLDPPVIRRGIGACCIPTLLRDYLKLENSQFWCYFFMYLETFDVFRCWSMVRVRKKEINVIGE